MVNKVKISPEVLKWARESLHLPEEAVLMHFNQKSKQKFKFNGSLLAKIENRSGEEIPFTLLQELSNFYKRPLAVFFLNKPPIEPVLPHDRRTIDSDIHEIISPAAVLAIRRARYVQEVFRDLSSELDISLKFPFKKFTLSDNPAQMGMKFREILDFSLDAQRRVRDARGLFDTIRVKLEGVNVFTIKSSFPLEDARAFSLVDQVPYLILINNKDGGYFGYPPKTFSLLHEFAHILLRESAICNDFNYSHQKIEKFCNSFAGSFLVPDEYFWGVLEITRKEFDMANLEDYLNTLKTAFKVSGEVLLRKCLTLKLIDDSFYNTKIQEWRDEYQKEKKRKEERGEKQFIPIITPGRRVISNNGRKFVELVLHARGEGKITIDSAADYLGVSLRSFPEVERLSVKPRSHA
ncbi:ImmA/IrrE family metallo-endopeptidase [Candidatus Azambacteria bacterium]|nr:ImmA/IrrE family metallo-endopeptidase [Candidatus Azambacteria bacterium]MBI3685009.1 ImmA/IrrE family metallo-endopeptidase [Candidatus Azambacteria bacterium]